MRLLNGSPTLRNLLVVNQLRIHYLFGSGPDVVHCSDPGHLIGGLELLGDAFGAGHLINQLKERFFRLPVHLLKMGVLLVAE